jgi:predicted lipid-binding transport protein (Tim44 family)
MNYSFEYIDIILLAMIAGFIFLRLRGILGKKTGHEEDMASSFAHDFNFKKPVLKKEVYEFEDNAKKEFLKGAEIAYETIITSFANGKLSEIKSLLNKDVYNSFSDAIKERSTKQLKNETTFIGINSSEIKDHNQNNDLLEVSVNFISEIITCIKDKENKIVSGDPQKIKRVNDTWKFSRNVKSQNPNWQLVETEV